MEEEIEILKEETRELRASNYQLRDKKEQNAIKEFNYEKTINERLDRQVRDLMEIIRWQVNPETAKAPFQPTKDQRYENDMRVNNGF